MMGDSKAAEAAADSKEPLLEGFSSPPPPAYEASQEQLQHQHQQHHQQEHGQNQAPPPQSASSDDATSSTPTKQSAGATSTSNSNSSGSSSNNARPPGSSLPRPPFPLDLPILNSIRGQRVILASASPRRRQILSQLAIPNLEILPCPLPESLPKTLSPFEYALRTAERKALHVYQVALNDPLKGDPALLIAADTIVISPGGSIFEKPRSAAEHGAMLRALRDGGRHSVVTGMAVMAPLESARDPGYRLLTAVEESGVVFDRDVSDELLDAYVATREGADKAGGYGVQGLGSILVERVEGSWDNVVGLPLRVVLKLIGRVLDQDEELEDEVAAGGFVLGDDEE